MRLMSGMKTIKSESYALTFLIQIMDPFFSCHMEGGKGVKIEVCVFHSDGANLSAIIGCEIIGQVFGIHTRGIDSAELSFIGSEESVWLIYRTHKMKEPRN